MDKLSRYLFILLSLIIFLVVAPLIILYVSGTKLNLTDRDYEPTGIITAETLPSNANVYLDSREPVSSPATIRFLTQGEYNVRITKDGYFDWKKKLSVESNQVTYAHEGVEAVHLIRKPQPIVLADSGVTSFALSGDTVWFGTAGKMNWRILGSSKTQSAAIGINPKSIYQLRNSKYLVVQNETGGNLLFDTDSKTVTQLPKGCDTMSDLNLASGSILLGRSGNVLLACNITKKISTPLLNDITGFTLLDNTAYVAVRQGDKTFLQTMLWNGATLSEAQNLIQDSLPQGNGIKLIITDSRELFVLINETLYRANASLETISTHVTNAQLDSITDELTFSTPSELWFYNFLRSKPQLLTRNTSTVNSFLIKSGMGYGFIGTPEGMYALEIDSRDQQNKYELIGNQPVWKIAVTGNLKTSLALSGDKLVMIPLAD